MNLNMLKANSLSKKQLQTINAGFLPDCEPGDTRIGKNGFVWVCNTFCAWELPDDPANEE